VVDKKLPFWTNVEVPCQEGAFLQWKMTQIALDGCWFDDRYAAILPKTDSRLRADRLALEKLDYENAAKEKHKLEEAQRARRRISEQKNKPHVPKYFVETKLPDGTPYFVSKNNYWTERQERVNKLSGGQ